MNKDGAKKGKGPERIEDYSPGATREEVLAALGKTAKPIKKPEK